MAAEFIADNERCDVRVKQKDNKITWEYYTYYLYKSYLYIQ